MPIISAAALGALVGAAMPSKGGTKSLRGTRKRAAATNIAALRRRQRYRRRGGKLTKRQWQARARRMVGNKKGFSTAKTTETQLPSTAVSVKPRELSSKTLINISSTATNETNERQRYTCVISGIKIDATFQNLSSSLRLYVNWAIVHGKQGQTINANTPDFFRRYSDERAFDANDYTNITGLTSSVAQINTDEFVILKRGKFLLTPTGFSNPAGFTDKYNYGAATKEKSIWLKLGRQFYFDPGSSQPQDQIYFVCWPAYPEEDAGALSATNVLQYRLRAIAYWREPRGA